MDKKNLTLLIAILVIISLAGYIATDKINLCEQAKNDSYAAGYNQGVETWNSAVIYNINTNSKVPYWFNGSYYELPISLGVQND